MLTIKIAEARFDAGRQSSATLSWGAVWDRAAPKISLTAATQIAGEPALQSWIAAEVKWLPPCVREVVRRSTFPLFFS
jgi:hypothetical protein